MTNSHKHLDQRQLIHQANALIRRMEQILTPDFGTVELTAIQKMIGRLEGPSLPTTELDRIDELLGLYDDWLDQIEAAKR